MAPREWILLAAALAVVVVLIGRGSSAANGPAWDVKDGACTDRRITSALDHVTEVPCEDPTSRVRVVSRFWLPEGPYPGRGAAISTATLRCSRPADDPRLGVLDAVVPSAQEWEDGSRIVLCTYLIG